MNLSRSRLIRLGVGVILTAVFAQVTIAASAANADTSSPPTGEISWAVRPSDGEIADGRSSMTFELDPGESANDYVEVTNLSKATVSFSISAADGYTTPQGRFNMYPSDRESTDAGTWIALERDEVTIDAGQSATVPFEITVPDNATPGDHPAGIAASVLSVAQTEDGATMGVESRVGFRVLTRVTGDLVPAVVAEDVTASYVPSWNPVQPGAVEVTYIAANAGNTRLSVDADVSSSALGTRARAAASPEPIELLPGDRREMTARVLDVWPLGFATVEVRLDTSVPDADGDGAAGPSSTAAVVVWTVPWLELALLFGAGLIIVALFWGRRRQVAKVDRLVAEAREEWEKDAADSQNQKIAE